MLVILRETTLRPPSPPAAASRPSIVEPSQPCSVHAASPGHISGADSPSIVTVHRRAVAALSDLGRTFEPLNQSPHRFYDRSGNFVCNVDAKLVKIRGLSSYFSLDIVYAFMNANC
ncbi:hypothetical protein PIB30_049821 [Stylosanthes scabra]|uniref:Uncharacterized protein n=1 Tax=Stylosanthes scabra TaxID=79078 RepID=A0ABU6WHE3_9FABA|nr:hypothetical protein [Stylosanthes scabra]